MTTNHFYGYIRVSTARQGKHSVSLPEQKNAIQAFADRNGLVVIEWFEEKVTAAKRGRPVFGKMLSALKIGKASGVIMHKIDRGARNLKDWADLAELIDLGVKVHFANESLDLSSRGGRLSADIQAVVAADYIRNLREETKKGIYGRLKQGIYPLRAPLGYLDKGSGKVKEIDPVRAPLIKRVFELYGTGQYSLYELQAEAGKLGLESLNGNPISRNSLSIMLNNPFYMGLIHIKRNGKTFKGLHEPIISATLFKRVQAVLQGKNIKKTLTHDFLFRRLLTCEHCLKTLTGERQKGRVYYRCHTGGCLTKGIREDAVDSAIMSQLSPLQFSPYEMEFLMANIEELRGQQSQDQEDIVKAIEMKLGQIEGRLNRLTDTLVDGLIDKDAFNRRNESLLIEKAELQERLATIKGGGYSLADDVQTFFELANTAEQTYLSGIPIEKRDLLKTVSSNRLVDRKNVMVELDTPFYVVANRQIPSHCGQQRYSLRTLAGIFDQVVKFIEKKRGDTS